MMVCHLRNTSSGCTMIRVYPIVVGRTLEGYLANSADPDQMPQNAVSDQGLQCLQIVQAFFSQKI